LKREFPANPIVAASGIVIKNRKVLLVRRKNPPDKNLWSIPGGAVELGETLIEAAQREINEECGITVKNGMIAAVIDKIYFRENKVLYDYAIIDFLFNDFTGNLRHSSDALDAQFFNIAEAKNSKDVAQSVKDLLIKITENTQDKFPIYLSYIVKD
jgi:8-oxo-dGTP diphosphatase